MKKDNNYTILFVDPKGTEHTDAYRKIDGYSRIFEDMKDNQKTEKCFSFEDSNIRVKLLLKGEVSKVPNNYKKYWSDNFSDFADKIKGTVLTEKEG